MSHHIRSDRTVGIKIRLSHNRSTRFLDTGLVASVNDLVKEDQEKAVRRIKTRAFIEQCDDIISKYRKICNKNADRIKYLDIDDLVKLITAKDDGDVIDFLKYGYNYIEYNSNLSKGTLGLYKTALNSLKAFAGPVLPVAAINYRFLTNYTTWIKKQHAAKNEGAEPTRSPSLYLGIIRTLHNAIKAEVNDEEAGIIRVPYSPFSKFKVPKDPPANKRALSVKQLIAIFDLKDTTVKNSSGYDRLNTAKNCFKLSFYLMGMNAADLYYCDKIENGYLVYERQKTRTRRDDRALIKVKIPPEIKPLMDQYKDPDGVRVFNFYKQYATKGAMNQNVNLGLKRIDKDLTFYAARHSWATIARNEVGIDKYVIHEALNHVDEKMKVTDVYLEKDWSVINDANRQVINYINKQKKALDKSKAKKKQKND